MQPTYPKEALRAGGDALVVLRAVVTAEGKTKDVSGPAEDSEFARAALRAVHRWHFYPISMNDQPVYHFSFCKEL